MVPHLLTAAGVALVHLTILVRANNITAEGARLLGPGPGSTSSPLVRAYVGGPSVSTPGRVPTVELLDLNLNLSTTSIFNPFRPIFDAALPAPHGSL